MKGSMPIFAALALAPVAVYAHDGSMHAKAGGEHSEDGRHAQGAGKPGDPKKVSRAIQVVMSDDMKFAPAKIDVKRGETIRFVVRNAGQITHEMIIGSMVELKEHAEMMRKMPGMEHAEPNQVKLDPGKTGELIWRFTKAGTFDFAC